MRWMILVNLTELIILTVFSTDKVEKIELLNLIDENSQLFPESPTCSICMETLFYNHEHQTVTGVPMNDIIQEINTKSVEDFTSKYFLFFCNRNAKHVFHGRCLYISLKENLHCPLCRFKLQNTLVKEFKNLLVIKISKFPPALPNSFKTDFQIILTEKLIKILNIRNLNERQERLTKLKENIPKNDKFSQFARIVVDHNIANLLIYISEYISELFFENMKKIYTAKLLSNLLPEQVFVVLENINKSSIPGKDLICDLLLHLANQLLIMDEFSEEKYYSFEDYCYLILKVKNVKVMEMFFFLIFSKLKPDHSFVIDNILLFAKNCVMKGVPFRNMKRVYVSLIGFYKISYEDVMNIKEFKSCFNENDNNNLSDEITAKIIRRSIVFGWIFNEEMKCVAVTNKIFRSKGFFDRSLAVKVFYRITGNYSFLHFDSNGLKKIINQPELRKILEDYLCSLNVTSVYLLLNILGEICNSNEEKHSMKETIDQSFEKIEKKYNMIMNYFYKCKVKNPHIIEIVKNPKVVIEEFIKRCAVNKRIKLESFDDFMAIIKIFTVYPDIRYLSYYFLDDSDHNLTKDELNEARIDQIIEEKFNINSDGQLEIFENYSNRLFLASYSDKFFKMCFIQNINPEKIVDEFLKFHESSTGAFFSLLINRILRNLCEYKRIDDIFEYTYGIVKRLNEENCLDYPSKDLFIFLTLKRFLICCL